MNQNHTNPQEKHNQTETSGEANNWLDELDGLLGDTSTDANPQDKKSLAELIQEALEKEDIQALDRLIAIHGLEKIIKLAPPLLLKRQLKSNKRWMKLFMKWGLHRMQNASWLNEWMLELIAKRQWEAKEPLITLHTDKGLVMWRSGPSALMVMAMLLSAEAMASIEEGQEILRLQELEEDLQQEVAKVIEPLEWTQDKDLQMEMPASIGMEAVQEMNTFIDASLQVNQDLNPALEESLERENVQVESQVQEQEKEPLSHRDIVSLNDRGLNAIDMAREQGDMPSVARMEKQVVTVLVEREKNFDRAQKRQLDMEKTV